MTLLPEEGETFFVWRCGPGLPLLVDVLRGGLASLRSDTNAQTPHHYSRTGALKAFGNAIVPQLAAEVIGAFLDTEQARANG